MATLSDSDNTSIFAVPAVPVAPKAVGQSDEYTGRIARQLSAAAYVRPNRLESVRQELIKRRSRAADSIRRWLRLKTSAEADASAADGERQAPAVVLGLDYAVWVRERITTASHRMPVHAFDQASVLRACDAAIRQARFRAVALASVVIGTVLAIVLGGLTLGTAVSIGVTGCWVVYLADRYNSQCRMNALLGGDLLTGPVDPPSYALPYVRKIRKGERPRDRFLGAGLQAWPPAVIGIDVESAPEREDDESYPPFVPNPRSGSRKSEDIADAVLAALSQHGNQTGDRKPMKHFQDTDLHAYVIKRLSNPAPSHDRNHPKPRIDVIGIAGISAERWAKLDDTDWRSLQSLAVNDKVSTVPGMDIARRYIWARVTAWNGELVASVLVHFAYEGGFLRVTVRPHVMAPLNPAVDGLGAENPRTLRWFGLAALHAVGDVAAGAGRLFRRTSAPAAGPPTSCPNSGESRGRSVCVRSTVCAGSATCTCMTTRSTTSR